jgi:hypothetical protein
MTLPTTFTAQRLYELLPAYDRIRDQESGGALAALVTVLAEAAAAVEEDLAQLYDDQFIETCAPWAVPYLGDLIGYRTLPGATAAVRAPRAEVADTIGLRRRKGTAAVLEQLAHDVTGWNARVVEFFRLLDWTQHLRHLRPELRAWADLRDGTALERLGGAFDPVPRTVDLRRGRHNIPAVGVFLWRLAAFRVADAPATPVTADPRRYRFDPLGTDTQLVNVPVPEDEVTHLADPVNVPAPLSYRELDAHLADYWGRALAVHKGRSTVDMGDVSVCNLADDPGNPGQWVHVPTSGLSVDPVLGRIAFGTGEPAPADVRVTYHRAFSAPMGGGEYDRAGTFDPTLFQSQAPVVAVPGDAATVAAALAVLGGADGVIEIRSNDPVTLPALTLAAGQRVELRAADERRPLLRLAGDTTVDGGRDAELILNGFLVTGGSLRAAGRLRRLVVRHCTLVPGGGPSVVQAPDPSVLATSLAVDASITGPLRLADEVGDLTLTGSIVDAGDAPRASPTRLLLSGTLAPFPVLSSPTPQLRLTIGDDGPHEITLAAAPATLAAAADALRTAIRAAAPSPAFGAADVAVVATRLAIVAGTGERVAVEPAGTDPSGAELRLDPASARRTAGLLGAALRDPPPVASATPAVSLRIGDREATVDGIGATPATLAALRVDLQQRIRATGTGAGFTGALVGVVGTRLLIVPGTEVTTVAATGTAADPTTVTDLGLDLRPSVGSGASGAEPAASATIDRSTLIGPVYLHELTLATNALFTDPVWTLRRQVGCVRFCWLPPASQTPRRHRCQPADPRDADRIRPTFTTLRYGLPGYGQLGPAVPDEIAAGADDGAEVGAFHDLFQHQRLANLHQRLDEYLRFGLEAGVVFVS